MNANSIKIAKVFSSGGEIHYVLPHFQREYSWGKTEWDTLLNDAFAIHDEMPDNDDASEIEHFLGSLVVVNSGTVAGTVTAFKLVDGQQRLTTVSLLLCALRRIVGTANVQLSRKIQRMLLNEDEQGDVHFKLLPTSKYGDREAYKAVLRDKDLTAYAESRIPVAFEYIATLLRMKVDAGAIEPNRLFRALTNAFQVVFIELNQQESPYKIFESLNAKGKPLTQADLVRNFIAMCLPASGQEEVFCDHWADIEQKLQEKRTVGRSGIGELTAFLRHYLAMHSRVLCNEKHVYARFRDRMNREFSDPSAFVQEIITLHEYSIQYDRLLRPERHPDKIIRDAMDRLTVLDISTAYPFLLALSNANSTGVVSTAEFADALEMLENYLMRRFLAEEPTNYLNKMFPQLWPHVDTDNFLPSLQAALVDRRYPSDHRILQKLMTRPLYRNNQTTRYQIGFLLEQINRHLSSGTGGFTDLHGAATIEHVLPQSPGQVWKEEIGEEYSRFEEFVHTLGNLTLVNQEWNSSLSNASFVMKKARLSTHALRLNSEYFGAEIKTWNEAAIQERTSYLVGQITHIWPQFVSDSEQSGAQEVSSFHPDVVQKVARQLGTNLEKQSQTQYCSPDKSVRVSCAVSKPYQRSHYKGYWFAFHRSQYDFLSEGDKSFAVFGCGSPDTVIILPFALLDSVKDKLNKTLDRGYWHIKVFEQQSHLVLGLPGLENGLDLTAYRLV